MKQIKVPLSPKEWAEKRLQLYASFTHQPSVDVLDNAIEKCGFYLLEEIKRETKPDEVPTDKVEAVKYFLNQLPDGYRERALAQVNEERVNNYVLATSIDYAISTFRLWGETKEGVDFWMDVHQHYSTPDKYPTLPPLPDDEKSTSEWTGYFTDSGERVNRGGVYQVNHIRYWIVEECLGDQCKFIALDGNGKKHQLNNLFKYHKP